VEIVLFGPILLTIVLFIPRIVTNCAIGVLLPKKHDRFVNELRDNVDLVLALMPFRFSILHQCLSIINYESNQ